MKAARIENGIVADLWEVPSLTCFEGMTLLAAPADVAMGAAYDGMTFINPPSNVNKTYRELRAAAYPPVTDGLDAMVKGGQALEDYKAACMAVKAKYPKV